MPRTLELRRPSVTRPVTLLATLLSTLLATQLTGCSEEAAAPSAADPFREITATSGVAFTHTVEPTGTFALPEILGAGCAVFDADGDGLQDLYFTDAGKCGGPGAPNRLFLRNADGTYRDATAASGLGDRGYGMGVAIGDIDNDGDLDVYVANDGPDALYRNEGAGRFADVTKPAGLTGRSWATSVAFVDYDADGWLDVFVVHYVDYDPDHYCATQDGNRDYCTPNAFTGVADKLYHNRGDGTFEDATTRAGIGGVASNGLGVIVDDFDDDGWPDVFVANDGQANHLWINERDGTFREEGLPMGVAVNAFGAAEASMGVAAGDVDADGDIDLFMTHLYKESNTLYVREAFGFVDRSQESGLASPSFQYTGFGTAMFDYDHDGDLDVAVVNGRVQQNTPDPRARIDPLWNHYAEPNQLFANDGAGKFTDISTSAAQLCAPVEVSRALAIADLDGDGDLDLVVTNCKGPARIYANVAQKNGHWLAVRAYDATRKRDVYGSVVKVFTGERTHRRTIGPGNSYLASSNITAHFGLGSASAIDRIEVRWPGGESESFPGGAIDTTVTLVRGEGTR